METTKHEQKLKKKSVLVELFECGKSELRKAINFPIKISFTINYTQDQYEEFINET